MRDHVTDHELLLFREGALPERRQAWVTRHVDECRACREQADRLQATLAAAAACCRAEDDVAPERTDYRRVRLQQALEETARTAPGPIWARPLDAGWLSSSRGLAVGTLVLLAMFTAALVAMRGAAGPADRTSSPLPERSLTPGAVSQLTAAELCNGVRPSRIVTEEVRQRVLREYGMASVPADAYELDALITPELGGSTDPANLWPQPYHSPVWNARVKDELERLLPDLVCSDQITLARAQREIATDWVAAYQRHFDTELPLRAHTTPMPDEEEELVFVPGEPVIGPSAALRLARR
jgi:hypothetical protein